MPHRDSTRTTRVGSTQAPDAKSTRNVSKTMSASRDRWWLQGREARRRDRRPLPRDEQHRGEDGEDGEDGEATPQPGRQAVASWRTARPARHGESSTRRATNTTTRPPITHSSATSVSLSRSIMLVKSSPATPLLRGTAGGKPFRYAFELVCLGDGHGVACRCDMVRLRIASVAATPISTTPPTPQAHAQSLSDLLL